MTKDETIAHWAARHDIGGTMTDLRCMFDDAVSLTNPLAQPEQEPAFYTNDRGSQPLKPWGKSEDYCIPLYYAAAQRTWVGLTPERKRDMAESYFSEEWAIYRAEKLLSGCEAALQKENT